MKSVTVIDHKVEENLTVTIAMITDGKYYLKAENRDVDREDFIAWF